MPELRPPAPTLLGEALVLGLAPLLLLLGCAKPPETCLTESNHAVWKGSAISSQLPLSLGQTYAVAAIEDAGGAVACSGVVIGEGLALSAAHCRNTVAVATGSADHTLRSLVLRTITHATQDVRLLVFATGDELARNVTPLELARDPLPDTLVGSVATLAGFGQDEQGRSGTRLFVDEPIVAISNELIDVDGSGLTGACSGDSGGPLLNADAKVLGVLSRGAGNCHGVDHYARIDNVVAWLDAAIAEPSLRACGDVTSVGACTDGGALWCEGEQLKGSVCRGKEVCTYVDDAGYRCVDVEASACGGLGEQGQCEGEVAAWCENDRIIRQDCATCGHACVRDGAQRARCH